MELLVALALVLASLCLVLIFSRKIRILRKTLGSQTGQVDSLAGQVVHTNDKLTKAESEVLALRRANLDLERNLSAESAHKELTQKLLSEQKTHYEQVIKDAHVSFENVAHQVLERSQTKFSTHSKSQLESLLIPFKERIDNFSSKVEKAYESEARERFHLRAELNKMILANVKISQDADNLTRALKGQSKVQGNWGEVQLELILEQSGLRDGEEFVKQSKALKLADDEGNRFYPDIVINLPDEKHVIIDAKVSLVSYERYVNSESVEESESQIKEFSRSLKQHIDALSDKYYHRLNGINTPDFVLMFCPIESAFSLSMTHLSDIFSYAWGRRVVMVSPTTLLASLKTIASLWKTERQNRNALEIARRGGALYDKFAGFVFDMDKIGKSLSAAQADYSQAMGKLTEGKGNLLSSAEKLKELGAKTKKKLETSGRPVV